MPITKRLIFVLAPITFLAACQREGAPARRIAADPAFCSQVHTTGAKLSEHLAPLAPLMRTSTGVYSLEEGDVSLVSRAWLAEAAERTIDVQYFIFSADKHGEHRRERVRIGLNILIAKSELRRYTVVKSITLCSIALNISCTCSRESSAA